MGFLKNLFGGGGGRSAAGDDRRTLIYYVRPKRCQEVVVVRVDLMNDLSLNDDGGYFCRKIARAMRCPFPAELHIDFDRNHKVTQIGVQDGELVERADYETWAATQSGGGS